VILSEEGVRLRAPSFRVPDVRLVTVRIALAVDPSGAVGHSWGKARTVAVVTVRDGSIVAWDEFDVAWDEAHDQGAHGSHHARVVRFLREHEVDTVLAAHVGEPMVRMLNTMGVRLELGVAGEARAAVEAVAAVPPSL